MVDTDPHASKAQLDDPHDNPKYDTNSDGTVDAVDSTAVDHDQTANRTHQGDDITPASVRTDFEEIKADGDLPSVPYSASEIIRGDSSGRAIILQNQDDSVQNGAGKANIQWISDAEERLATIVSHPFDNHLSFYVKPDSTGSGDTGLVKMLDMEGGTSPYPHIQWTSGPEEHNFENQGVIRFSSDKTTGGREFVLYRRLSDALSELRDGDRLVVNGDTFDPITISNNGVTLVGASRGSTRFDGSDGTGITIDGNNVTVRNVAVAASGAGNDGIEINGNDVHVESVSLLSVPNNHINVGGDRALLTGMNRLGGANGSESVLFESGTTNGLVDQYLNAGTITDNGTNTTGTTT